MNLTFNHYVRAALIIGVGLGVPSVISLYAPEVDAGGAAFLGVILGMVLADLEPESPEETEQ